MGGNNHLDKILSNSSLTSDLKEWRMLINLFHLHECISSAVVCRRSWKGEAYFCFVLDEYKASDSLSTKEYKTAK